MKKQMFIILLAAAGTTFALAQNADTTANGNSSLATTATQPSTQPANNSGGSMPTNAFGRQHYVLQNGAATNQPAEFNSTTNTSYTPQSSTSATTNANEHHHWWQFWK